MSEQLLPFSKEAQVAAVTPKCSRTGQPKRSCKCPSCIGRRNKRKGSVGQRTARKALGLRDEKWIGRHANEESWTSAVRVEVKAGGTMANPIQLRYDKMRAQSDAATPIGDVRPFVGVVKADGYSDVIVLVKGSDLPAVVGALIEEWTEGTRE